MRGWIILSIIAAFLAVSPALAGDPGDAGAHIMVSPDERPEEDPCVEVHHPPAQPRVVVAPPPEAPPVETKQPVPPAPAAGNTIIVNQNTMVVRQGNAAVVYRRLHGRHWRPCRRVKLARPTIPEIQSVVEQALTGIATKADIATAVAVLEGQIAIAATASEAHRRQDNATGLLWLAAGIVVVVGGGLVVYLPTIRR